MTQHATAKLAWSLWGLSIALTALFVLLVFVSRTGPGSLEYDSAPLLAALYAALVLIFSTLGALIAARQPGNAVGWLFLSTGVVLATGLCTQLYADYAPFNRPGSIPGGELAAWAASWLLPVGLFVTPVVLLFLFPSGSPASSRWRIVFQLAVAITVLTFAGAMFKPGPVDVFEVQNPVALRGAAGDAMELLEQAGTVAVIPLLLLGVSALVTRMRGSRGQERQQLKWFAFTASLMGVSFAASFVCSALGLSSVADIFFIVGAVGLFLIPIASGLAILKYRLYDIDRIINRTLVYGALFIDRRFYRRKYDAARTLEAFTAQVRDEIDLESLTGHLLSTVQETVQPARLSLWLRSSEAEPHAERDGNKGNLVGNAIRNDPGTMVL